MQDRFKKYVVYLLLISFGWLFSNQAMNTHSHQLVGGQIITHVHPYTPDKGSHSPFQSHKHLPSIAFFLDLITRLNLDSFEQFQVFLFILGVVAIVPVIQSVAPINESCSFGISRAPPIG